MQKRVRLPLFAYCSRRTVATYEGHIITQWKQLGLDRFDQGIMVAIGKVGAAD